MPPVEESCWTHNLTANSKPETRTQIPRNLSKKHTNNSSVQILSDSSRLGIFPKLCDQYAQGDSKRAQQSFPGEVLKADLIPTELSGFWLGHFPKTVSVAVLDQVQPGQN